MSWEKVKLGDIAIVTSSKRFHLSERSDSGVPFYCSKQIIQKVRGELVSDYDYIREEFYENVKKQYGVPEPGDLLITTRGSYGVPYIYKDNDKFYFADGNLTWLKDFKENIDVRFLYYWICSYEGQKKIDAIAKGTAQKAVTIDGIKNLEISVPSFKTQKRIADILSAYDNLIENNQKQIKLLEEAAQRLYKQWFIDLRYPGHETTKIVNGLPEGWRIVSLGDVYGKIESGSRPKGGIDSSIRDGVVSVGAENVIGLGQYNYSSEKLVSYEFYENSKRGRVEDRDILVYKDGAYIGRTSLFQDEFPRKVMMVNEHVFLLNAKDPLYQYYLFFTLNRKEYFDKMQKLNKNSAQPGINQDALKSLVIIWPQDEIVMKFDNSVAPMVKKIFALAKQNYELSQSRDRLLPKLMNGE